MTDIVIFGAGQFAEVLTVYLEQDTNDKVVGYTVDNLYCSTDTFNGLPLVAWENLESHFPPSQVQLLGPISYRGANRFRKDRFLEGKSRGYAFYTFIHPSAYIYSNKIGENVIILEGNTLQPFVEIGDNCILWSHNHVGHHTIIKAHNFLCGRVTIGGNVVIEEGVFWAGCTTAKDNINIGAWSFLTPGTIALENIPEDSILVREKNRLLKKAAHKHYKKLLG